MTHLAPAELYAFGKRHFHCRALRPCNAAAAASSPNRLGATFDFTRIFSAGRLGTASTAAGGNGALSLLHRTGGPGPWYEDLPDYPFSARSAQGRATMPSPSPRSRDTHAPLFDLSVRPAAPFGMTDRYDSTNGCKA